MSQNKNSAAVKKNKLFTGIPDSEISLPYIGRHLQAVHPIWMKFGTIAQWGTRRIVV